MCTACATPGRASPPPFAVFPPFALFPFPFSLPQTNTLCPVPDNQSLPALDV